MKILASLLVAAAITFAIAACSDDTCSGNSCVCSAQSDCDRTCDANSTCSIQCNGAPNCTVNGGSAASLQVDCATSGTCDVTCPAVGCRVTCPATGCTVNNCTDPSSCIVSCGGAGAATYSGTSATCP